MGTIWAIARAIGKKYCTRLLLLIRQVRVSLRPKGGLKEGTKTRRRIFLAKRHSQGKCPNGSSKLCQFLLSLKTSYAKSGYVSMEDISPKNTNSCPRPHIVDHHHSRRYCCCLHCCQRRRRSCLLFIFAMDEEKRAHTPGRLSGLLSSAQSAVTAFASSLSPSNDVTTLSAAATTATRDSSRETPSEARLWLL